MHQNSLTGLHIRIDRKAEVVSVLAIKEGGIIMKNVVPGVWVWEVGGGEPHVPE